MISSMNHLPPHASTLISGRRFEPAILIFPLPTWFTIGGFPTEVWETFRK